MRFGFVVVTIIFAFDAGIFLYLAVAQSQPKNLVLCVLSVGAILIITVNEICHAIKESKR